MKTKPQEQTEPTATKEGKKKKMPRTKRDYYLLDHSPTTMTGEDYDVYKVIAGPLASKAAAEKWMVDNDHLGPLFPAAIDLKQLVRKPTTVTRWVR